MKEMRERRDDARIRKETVSLLVDEIGDVLEVEDQTFEAPPETLQGVAREFIRGAYKLKDRLMLVLDTEKGRLKERRI